MPYRDKHERTCGFLDIEMDTESNHFVRRFFMLNPVTKILEYYMDNPLNLPAGTDPVGLINMQYVSMATDAAKIKPKCDFCFSLTVTGQHRYFKANDEEDRDGWIQVLNDAARITVPASGSTGTQPGSREVQENELGFSYKAEVVGGVLVRTPVEDGSSSSSSSSDSDDDDERSMGLNSATWRQQSSQPEVRTQRVIKSGFCKKEGALRKNWKRRYFKLDDEGLSYFKPTHPKVPIRTIPKAKIREARISVGIHVNRDNIFEVVTEKRVFYIQTNSPDERHSWISCIKQVLNKGTRTLQERISAYGVERSSDTATSTEKK